MRLRRTKPLSRPKEPFPINSDVLEQPSPWQTYIGQSPAHWPLCVLVVGNAGSAEFAGLLTRLTAWLDVQIYSSVGAAIAESSAEPDLIVLLATRPGEFSAGDIERLRRAAPLARLVSVLGSWHEGETRTGRPWPAVERVNWSTWPAWSERELAALEQGTAGTLSLPSTATDEERLLHLMGMESPGASTGIVEIIAGNNSMRELLADTCRAASYQPCVTHSWLRSDGAAPVAGIFDVPGSVAESLAELKSAVQHHPQTPWIVLASYARAADRDLALRIGAAELMAKPILISDLMAAVDRVRSVR